MCPGFLQHGMGLGGISCHPRLAHDMLARLQRGTGHLAVQIRPSADDNGVGVIRSNELTPILVDFGNMKGIGNPLGGLAAAVTHTDDLDPLNRLQPGDVPHAGVIPRSDDANSDGC